MHVQRNLYINVYRVSMPVKACVIVCHNQLFGTLMAREQEDPVSPDVIPWCYQEVVQRSCLRCANVGAHLAIGQAAHGERDGGVRARSHGGARQLPDQAPDRLPLGGRHACALLLLAQLVGLRSSEGSSVPTYKRRPNLQDVDRFNT